MIAIVRSVQYWNKISDSVTFLYKQFMKTTNTFLDHVVALADGVLQWWFMYIQYFRRSLPYFGEYIPEVNLHLYDQTYI